MGVDEKLRNASYVNSFRISACADRLALHVSSSHPKTDPPEFLNLCLSLARGIDFALANHEVPPRVHDLPLLMKQVCRHHNDSSQLAPVMVLMISVKNACLSGWFTEKDKEELSYLANEISSSFCSTLDFKTEPSSFLPIISTVMSRYYPRMKIGQILSFLEVKPGYGAFVNDFQIKKNLKLSEGEKVRLFVAQIDNLETSQCLVTPPLVSFLLNGQGVARRTNVLMDSGPQLPTPVPHMLKFGTNLLQAVGQFNGNYIVAVAFMSEITTPVQARLPDYEQPPLTSADPDSEIIEGPSRISLNCPISFTRIKTPVKGRSCKHLQCFDYDNYININSRRPSWRCPHCNQPVCFTDIHVDQDILKVLKDAGEDVSNVVISSDGSWKAIMENDVTEKPRDTTPDVARDSLQNGSDSHSNAPPDVCDLTGMDDEINPMASAGTRECKSSPTVSHNQSNVQKTAAVNNPCEINQPGASHMVDDYWSRMCLPSDGSGMYSSWSSLPTISASGPTRTIPYPVSADAISPTLSPVGNALIPTSVLQSALSSPNMPHLQLLQSVNFAMSNEYGRFPSASIHANRTPVAVLQAQMHTSVSHQRLEPTPTSLFRTGPSEGTQDLSAVSLDGSSVMSSLERRRFPLSDLDLLPAPDLVSSALSKQMSSQVVDHQTPNQRTLYAMSQSQGQSQSSTQPSVAGFPGVQIRQGSSQAGVTQATGLAGGTARGIATQQTTPVVRPVHSPRTASPLSGNADGFSALLAREQMRTMGGTSPFIMTDSPMDSQSDPNWRPTGRMRGSLSGQAYSEALNKFMKPTQQTQTARPSAPPNLSPQLQALLANRISLSTQAMSSPSTAPAKASNT